MANVKKVTLKSGETRWRVRFYAGLDPDTGKQEVITSTFERKKDADDEAAKLRTAREAGVRVTPSKEPLQKYLRHWLKEVKEGQVRARTLDDYRSIIHRYIEHPPDGVPRIGRIQLNRVTGAAFQALYDHLWRERGLSPRTIQYLHSILRQALQHAVGIRVLARNPTDGVRPKSQRLEDAEDAGQEKTTVAAMSQEEATRFLKAAREDRYFPLWCVLLTGGLRPGEALGLLWEDVNLEEGKLHVQRSLTRRGIKAPWKLTEPKTARARRVVPLPAMATQALREWKAKQAGERLLVGSEYENNGFVFATEFGKPLDGGNLYARNFRRIMAAAELGEWEQKGKRRRFRPAFRVYDLRHTCATLLLRDGVNVKVVSERLGHAKINLTLDTYSHVLPDMQETAADSMEAMFGSA